MATEPIIADTPLDRGAGEASPTIEARFWAKVQKTDSCWLWTASTITSGYGQLFNSRTAGRRRYVLAHRYAYELLVGPIPDGLVIDHLCRVRHCVNPAHMEPVTVRENNSRGTNPWANARRTGKCHRGHELTPGNYYTSGDRRNCRQCVALISRERYLRRVALKRGATA